MRQISILLWIGLGLAVARLGWVWLVRHDARARMEDSNQARHGQPYVVPHDDGSVDITQFYARSGQIVDGDSNLICYGVRNAKSVRIEPAVESLHPAPNRCFFVEPHEDTTYKLVAEGGNRQPLQGNSTVVCIPTRRATLLLMGLSPIDRRRSPELG